MFAHNFSVMPRPKLPAAQARKIRLFIPVTRAERNHARESARKKGKAFADLARSALRAAGLLPPEEES